ncbi:hypothetical protein FEK48_08240 [Escherichia sp. E2593]|nr:hypothetical protein D9738_08270 [Escherichia sp. E10V5]TLI72491.1 hypothetical protein FEK66_09320 [Escherichia sp. E1130]TLI82204.1 hypothetical protein FEK43_11960 [Escherichia sp. E2562]TLI86164.1 hypothetical protein FEK48_08240 [Escherichia sp. E2593]
MRIILFYTHVIKGGIESRQHQCSSRNRQLPRFAHNRHSLQLWQAGWVGESVKEKKTAASFDITAIF